MCDYTFKIITSGSRHRVGGLLRPQEAFGVSMLFTGFPYMYV